MSCSKLSTLTVTYEDLRGHGREDSKLGRVRARNKLERESKTVKVRFRLTDIIMAFIVHVCASFNGLQPSDPKRRASDGKQLYLKGERIDQDRNATLEDKQVRDGSHLILLGYTSLEKKQCLLPFHVELTQPDSSITSVEVQVTSRTTFVALKHKLQNKTGIHMSEFELRHRGEIVKNTTAKKSVQFYGGQSSTKEPLKMILLPTESAVPEEIATDGPFKPTHDTADVSPTKPDTGTHISTEQHTGTEKVKTFKGLLSEVPPVSVSDEGCLDLSYQNFDWFKIAIRLGLPDGDRTEIEADNQTLDHRKLKTLLRWKKLHGDEATWKQLLTAVCQGTNKAFAYGIVKTYHKLHRQDNTDSQDCASEQQN